MRRWWERYGSRFFMIGLVLVLALFVRKTQGDLILDVYDQLAQPFQVGVPPEQQWSDARVSELEARLIEIEQQNEKLQELVKYEKNFQDDLIPATVIGRSVDHWWEQLILDQGRSRGIEEGNVVSAPGGLVGRVVKVTENASRVLLISDPTSKIGVKIARSGSVGYIQGARDQPATMEFFNKVPEVKQGDKIVTSATSFLFPPGIPVGTVDQVDLEKSPAPEVTVKFTAPFNYLEWVMVHPFKPRLEPALFEANKPDRGSNNVP